MFLLVLSILCFLGFLIAGLVGLLDKSKTVSKTKAGLVAGIFLILGVLGIIAGTILIVPVGNVAVMVKFQKVTGEVLENGFHWKSIIQTPVIMSIKTQLFEDDAAAASKDLQDVKTRIAINFKLDPREASTVYKTIGHDYIAIIGNPIVQEVVKETTAKFNAEEMIVKRSDVKKAITDSLVTRLQERGVIVESVNITNFEFSASFTSAIEAKVSADQAVLTAQNKLRQVEVEAQMAKAQAEGEANAAIARANGQAEANKIVDASLTDKILRYMFIDKMGSDVKVWVVPDSQAFTITP